MLYSSVYSQEEAVEARMALASCLGLIEFVIGRTDVPRKVREVLFQSEYYSAAFAALKMEKPHYDFELEQSMHSGDPAHPDYKELK